MAGAGATSGGGAASVQLDVNALARSISRQAAVNTLVQRIGEVLRRHHASDEAEHAVVGQQRAEKRLLGRVVHGRPADAAVVKHAHDLTPFSPPASLRFSRSSPSRT